MDNEKKFIPIVLMVALNFLIHEFVLRKLMNTMISLYNNFRENLKYLSPN